VDTVLFLSDVPVDMGIAHSYLNGTRPFSAAVRDLREVLADSLSDVQRRIAEEPPINVDLTPAGRRCHADPGSRELQQCVAFY